MGFRAQDCCSGASCMCRLGSVCDCGYVVKRFPYTCIPGQPRVRHQSSSSARKHCSHKKALRASPPNANSRSSDLRVHSAASARVVARLNSCTTGITSAWRMSRCSSQVSWALASQLSCSGQKLEISRKVRRWLKEGSSRRKGAQQHTYCRHC